MGYKTVRRRTILIKLKKKNYTLIVILIILDLLCGNQVFAQDIIRDILSPDDDSSWTIDAKELKYNIKKMVISGKEDVVISNGVLTLSCDEAVYDTGNNTAKVSGGFLFELEDGILSGENAVFNLTGQTGKINEGRLFIRDGNYHIAGDSIEKTGDSTYMAEDFSLTTCDGECPVWSITGREIHIPLEGYATVRGAAFRIRDIPVLYVPYIIFPARTKRATGLLIPSAGYSGRNGLEMEFPFFWAISDRADATFYERYISKRGLMQGLEFRYASEADSKGTYNFDILKDRIDKKDMNDPDQVELSPFSRTNSGRYWLRGRTEQQLPWGIRARIDADVVSDQDYLREFERRLYGFEARPDLAEEYGRPLEEVTSPTRRSAMRFSRDSQDYSLQAMASYYQRPEGFSNDTAPQPLMGMSFSLLPRSFKGVKIPMTFSIDTDYDYIWRDFGQRGHNFSISPWLTFPTRIGSYSEFETSLRYTRDMQWLSGNSPVTDYQSKDALEFKTGLSTILERIYDTDWKEAKRIKHKIRPSLIYEYRTHKDENRYQPWFVPFDQEGKINMLSFSLENFLDAKIVDEKGNVSYSQWGTLRIEQGYNIDEATRDDIPGIKKKPFEPLTAGLTFSPYERLDFDAKVEWDHYTDDFSSADLSLRFDVDRSDLRKDEYRIDYVYEDSGNKGLGYYIDINLVEGFSIGSALNRDIETDHDIEKSFWIKYTSQCWGARMGIDKSDGESRIMLSFQILGFGD